LIALQSSVVSRQKAELRDRARRVRAECDASLASLVLARLLAQILAERATVVAGVWPLGDEIDLRPLLYDLHERGIGAALPETTPRGNPMIFRHWQPDTIMLPERFGTFRPDGPEVQPDLFLVPLLAFDRLGRRLGYGGGYYDRTLPLYPGRPAWGYAYAAQEVAHLPAEPHDHKLDAIITEAEIIKPKFSDD
jgi:5-formyltetrahydrofolate cyclo-ligase